MHNVENGKTCFGRVTNKKEITKKSLLFFGVASLLWFIFRTGSKPSRITYPCQQAALSTSSILLNLFIPLSLSAFFIKLKKVLSPKLAILPLIIIIATSVISGEYLLNGLELAGAVDPNQELQLTLQPRTATDVPVTDIYVVHDRTHSHISELIDLMGLHGLRFYQSDSMGMTQGPDGLIARDDVVLVKINEEWAYRGGTNTDVLKELIQAIVKHPKGFMGEIVVADNGQWGGSLDWEQNNAEDTSQSTQDVVNMFASTYNVSAYTWRPIRGTEVNEYSEGDMEDGYILYDSPDPETGIYVSYPKFQTAVGTYISFKHGVWNGANYEDRLKIINLPVLKSHQLYGVTASLKHYMGVQSEGEFVQQVGLANGHYTIATGGMGTLMAETGLPTLNILDAIWINANPPPASLSGPDTPYHAATRVNVLLASTDPVALDYWAAKHVLVQAANLIGYSDTHTLDPDSVDSRGVGQEAFSIWLNQTKDELLREGYNVTTNEDQMNVYVNPLPSEPPGQALTFNVTLEDKSYIIRTLSNSSVTDFSFSQTLKQISFNVTGLEGTAGFCNAIVPKNLLWGEFFVTMDGSQLTKNVDYIETFNGTHHLFYMSYVHSTHRIEITGTAVIPEFSTVTPMLLTLILLTIASVFIKRRCAYKGDLRRKK